MAKTRRFIYGRSRQLVFYVFFSIWRNFFFCFCFEYLNELPKRKREHEFFLMKRKPRILRAQIVFLLYLGTKYASFFSSFSLQFDGRRHVRHDDLTIFSDGYLPEFTKRQDPVFFGAKTGLLLAKSNGIQSNTIIGHQSFF